MSKQQAVCNAREVKTRCTLARTCVVDATGADNTTNGSKQLRCCVRISTNAYLVKLCQKRVVHNGVLL